MKFNTNIHRIRLFFIVLLLLIILDSFIIGTATKDIYKNELEGIVNIVDGEIVPVWWGIAIVYIFLSLAITYFVILRDDKQTELGVFLRGAFIGLIIYGVYDFANYSVIKGWPIYILIVDILWGTVLCGAAAISAYMIEKMISKI